MNYGCGTGNYLSLADLGGGQGGSGEQGGLGGQGGLRIFLVSQ